MNQKKKINMEEEKVEIETKLETKKRLNVWELAANCCEL